MAAKRQYRPGSRHSKFRRDGKMSENRMAWLRTALGQFILMRYPQGETISEEQAQEISEDEGLVVEPSQEIGDTYYLVIPRPYGKPLKLNLTALTMEELQKTRQFFNLLFDLAEPVVRERDQVAEDAFANGDDSHARIYRQVPQFIVRSGKVRENNTGIYERSEDSSEGAGDDFDPDGGVRGSRDELASSEQEEGERQDDRSQTDDSEGVRQVGEMG